jgi:hypothetical protein
MLSPIEAAALENIAQDRCTLQEVKDRLQLRGIAREAETALAVGWLLREGLISRAPAWRSRIYRATLLGELELTLRRRRELVSNMIVRTRTAA